MKLAASNIAWPAEADDAVADLLRQSGFTGIEIAPTKLGINPITVTPTQLAATRSRWADRDLPIIAAQALLFGKPELTLFDSETTRRQTLDYLMRVIAICGGLGVKCLVFGSPKNRRINGQPAENIQQIACAFFAELARCAVNEGTTIGLEANPVQYGGDYLLTAGEVLELVQLVNHPGLRWQFDTACALMAGDSADEWLRRGQPWLAHVHASEPFLAPIGKQVDHAAAAAALRQIGYAGWVSLEMKQNEPFDLSIFTDSLRRIRNLYGDPLPVQS